MEIETLVRTILVRCQCEVCGCDGWMEATGTALLSYPPQYPHKCSKCGAMKTFRQGYPYYKYVPEGELK